MNKQIGTCSLCGGAVTRYFGAWSGTQSPIASCESCGAVQSHTRNEYGGSYPTIPMQPKPYEVKVGGGSYGGGSYGGGGGAGSLKKWVGLKFDDYPDDEFPNADFRRGAVWAEEKLKERNK